MEIVHNQDAKCFEIHDDAGVKMGEIEYRNGGNRDLYATHTEVFEGYEGHGYAGKLLDALTDYAKNNNYKIVPICGYVISAFKRNPEKYADVIK